MNKSTIISEEKKYMMSTYRRYPLVVSRASGKYIWDEKGTKYLDFFSGLSVTNFGHCRPEIVKAIRKQAGKYLHTSNLYYAWPQIQLAKRLLEMSIKKGKVFFSNSGAEANECAVKMARRWGRAQRPGAHEIIVFKNSFHGRTIGTLSATAQKQQQKGFVPLLPGFKQAVFNDLASVKKLMNKKTCAVLIEPVQGEGGINIAGRNFLEALQGLCRKNISLLIFDEVQTAMGRTGKLFAYQHYSVKPDIITMAKALGGGLPLGATITTDIVAGVFSYGDHGSTFGGNPVCIAASLAAMKLLNKGLLDNVNKTGKYFIERLQALKNKYPLIIGEVRGLGLMVAMDLIESKRNISGRDFVLKCLEKGIMINCTQDKVIRFMPPLIVNSHDVDTVIGVMEEVLGGREGHLWIKK